MNNICRKLFGIIIIGSFLFMIYGIVMLIINDIEYKNIAIKIARANPEYYPELNKEERVKLIYYDLFIRRK